MTDALSQIVVQGGQVTVSVGLVVAGAAMLIKLWAGKATEVQELRLKNTQLERQINEEKAKATLDALERLKAVVDNHAKLFADFVQRLRRHEDALKVNQEHQQKLQLLFERILKALNARNERSEVKDVGKDSKLVRTVKPGEDQGDG